MDKRVRIIERLQMAMGGLGVCVWAKRKAAHGGGAVAPPRNQRRSSRGLSDKAHH